MGCGLAKMAGKQDTSVLQSSTEVALRELWKEVLTNSFCNKMLHAARVPSTFVTQELNEKLVCGKRRAGTICLHHKGRTGKGKCA